MNNCYHRGLDYFTPAPGSVKKMHCLICQEEMICIRNANSATSYIESIAGGKTKHDIFYCNHVSEGWHEQAVAIMMELDKTRSPSLKKLLESDIKKIVKAKKVQ